MSITLDLFGTQYRPLRKLFASETQLQLERDVHALINNLADKGMNNADAVLSACYDWVSAGKQNRPHGDMGSYVTYDENLERLAFTALECRGSGLTHAELCNLSDTRTEWAYTAAYAIYQWHMEGVCHSIACAGDVLGVSACQAVVVTQLPGMAKIRDRDDNLEYRLQVCTYPWAREPAIKVYGLPIFILKGVFS